MTLFDLNKRVAVATNLLTINVGILV
jgi:hypothetical protein